MKKKNKILNIFLVSLLVLGIVGFIYFSTKQSVIGQGNIDYTKTTLIENNPQYLKYKIEWISLASIGTKNDCNAKKILNLNYNTPYNPNNERTSTRLPSNFNNIIILPQTQKAESIELPTIQVRGSPCGDIRYSGRIKIINKNISALCTLSKGNTNSRYGTQAEITCKVNAQFEAERPGTWNGDIRGYAIIKFYKKGFKKETIYNLIDNKCISKEIFIKDKTNKDYSTLTECQNKIVKTIENTTNIPPTTIPPTQGGIEIEKPSSPLVLFVLIGIIIFIIMFLLYVKKKKRVLKK